MYLAKFNAFPVEVENETKNHANAVADTNAGRGNIFVICGMEVRTVHYDKCALVLTYFAKVSVVYLKV